MFNLIQCSHTQFIADDLNCLCDIEYAVVSIHRNGEVIIGHCQFFIGQATVFTTKQNRNFLLLLHDRRQRFFSCRTHIQKRPGNGTAACAGTEYDLAIFDRVFQCLDDFNLLDQIGRTCSQGINIRMWIGFWCNQNQLGQAHSFHGT